MTTYEQLQAKIRETPLLERLKQIPPMISGMCSKGRPPKMTIPVQATDEDIFITTTVGDVIREFQVIRLRAEEFVNSVYGDSNPTLALMKVLEIVGPNAPKEEEPTQ